MQMRPGDRYLCHPPIKMQYAAVEGVVGTRPGLTKRTGLVTE